MVAHLDFPLPCFSPPALFVKCWVWGCCFVFWTVWLQGATSRSCTTSCSSFSTCTSSTPAAAAATAAGMETVAYPQYLGPQESPALPSPAHLASSGGPHSLSLRCPQHSHSRHSCHIPHRTVPHHLLRASSLSSPPLSKPPPKLAPPQPPHPHPRQPWMRLQ